MGGVGSGSKPKVYDSELIEKIRLLYESGKTSRNGSPAGSRTTSTVC